MGTIEAQKIRSDTCADFNKSPKRKFTRNTNAEIVAKKLLILILSPNLISISDSAKNNMHKIPAIYGCLHLKYSWNRLNSLLQKPLAKLVDEKNHKIENKATVKQPKIPRK